MPWCWFRDWLLVQAALVSSTTKEAVALAIVAAIAAVWVITTFACLIIKEYTALVTIQPVMLLAVGWLIGFKKNGL